VISSQRIFWCETAEISVSLAGSWKLADRCGLSHDNEKSVGVEYPELEGSSGGDDI
jgi:hypothetical protein